MTMMKTKMVSHYLISSLNPNLAVGLSNPRIIDTLPTRGTEGVKIHILQISFMDRPCLLYVSSLCVLSVASLSLQLLHISRMHMRAFDSFGNMLAAF